MKHRFNFRADNCPALFYDGTTPTCINQIQFMPRRRMPQVAISNWSQLWMLTMVLGVLFSGLGELAAEDWKVAPEATVRYTINGTGDRNNPLRRQLQEPIKEDEVFVSFYLKYQAESIDLPDEGDGEFLVMWLDQTEGNDFATHSSGVPNIGLHVKGDKNHFMVRFASQQESYAAEVVGGKSYRVVGRLSKSESDVEKPFNRLAIWVDPQSDEKETAHAEATTARGVTTINWIGFSTGRKTEPDDLIELWDVKVARSWEEILGLPPLPKPEPLPPEPTVAFEKDVYPILKSHCFECHAGDDADSGIRLDIFDEVLNQTTPRDASKSHLIELVKKGEMPPEGPPLSQDETERLIAWVNEGLSWDEGLLPTPAPTSEHWAFQAIMRPQIPDVKNKQWVRTPVDAFILRRQEEIGIDPAPEADVATLNRRMSLDLLGLPIDPDHPSDQELSLDALLSQPAYGERWGRHWLDIARWAESNGHQHNRHRDFAWRYRDWVVAAFNQNLPYDQFVRQQVAGDELDPIST